MFCLYNKYQIKAKIINNKMEMVNCNNNKKRNLALLFLKLNVFKKKNKLRKKKNKQKTREDDL